jgi:SAM-dependent methyltransferase
VSVDNYAGSARRWAEGATIVYGPLAHQLLAASPHSLSTRTVLDIGAGTGVASTLLSERGARPLALDLSLDMLAWSAKQRPPAVVADVTQLPLVDDAVDDSVAAFVYNHLVNPAPAFAEVMRVTRPGGALLASVYSNANRSEVREAIDREAQALGWQVPDWYIGLKQAATPLLGTAENMARVAGAAGLVDIRIDERPVDIGLTAPEQLVDYRLGQAQFVQWLDALGSSRAYEVRNLLVDAIRPVMVPYLPIVVFLAATVP